MWSPWRIEVYFSISGVLLYFFPLQVEAYTTSSSGNPSPVVEFATEFGDKVGGVFGVLRLDQVVIVRDGLVCGAHDGLRQISLG